MVDFAAPDLDRFPRFAAAMETAQLAVLEPGDALYLPSLWVHHVQSPGLGAQINFWWRDGPAHLVTPFLTLLHGLLTVRDLPAAERERWRHLFNVFLFQTEGEPQAHLTDSARGVFGPATPENLQRIRTRLIASLGRGS